MLQPRSCSLQPFCSFSSGRATCTHGHGRIRLNQPLAATTCNSLTCSSLHVFPPVRPLDRRAAMPCHAMPQPCFPLLAASSGHRHAETWNPARQIWVTDCACAWQQHLGRRQITVVHSVHLVDHRDYPSPSVTVGCPKPACMHITSAAPRLPASSAIVSLPSPRFKETDDS